MDITTEIIVNQCKVGNLLSFGLQSPVPQYDAVNIKHPIIPAKNIPSPIILS